MVLTPSLWRMRHAKEELDRKLHRLQITDVDDPDAVCAILQGKIHLLPHLGDRVSIQPLVGARAANIVEVIVDTCAAGTFSLFRSRQPANITPVVVAPQQGYIIGHTHTLLVVLL